MATGDVTTATIACCRGCGPHCFAIEARIRRDDDTVRWDWRPRDTRWKGERGTTLFDAVSLTPRWPGSGRRAHRAGREMAREVVQHEGWARHPAGLRRSVLATDRVLIPRGRSGPRLYDPPGGGNPRTNPGEERIIDTITLWRPTGQAELDLVAASGWRAWPPRLPDQPIFYPVLNRWYATKIAREWNVRAEGVGHVTRFDVQRSYLDRYQVQQVGGRDVLEYWIPAENLADFNAHIVGAIRQEADYRGPVGDQEFTDAEKALGRPLPDAWRTYLQGGSWFRRGWIADETYVWLNTPRQMLELHEAWDASTGAHPGIAIIGNDGSRAQLVLDLRGDPAPVLLVDIVSAGWGEAVRQADDVGEFVDRIEAGTFEFDFGV